MNNQLQAHYLELVNHKQALQNRNKELVIEKTQLLKLQIENKHLIAKGVDVEKIINKAKALQQEYNELNQAHLKTHNDLKTLQIDFDRLTKDYGKMEAISVQQDKFFVKLEDTCLQQWE